MAHLVSQDLSVAGKRAGMKNVIMGDEDSTRSGLFFDAIRVVKEMRNESIKQLSMRGAVIDIRHIQPRYTVYENVPGAFSSNGGEDFRCVLEETCKVADENAHVPQLEKGQRWANAGCIVGDGYSVAWRLHDAQFWGVPQRRKRICVLADYGGDSAAEILFELVGETNDSETFKAIADIRNTSESKVQAECKGLSGNTKQGNEKGQGTSKVTTDSVGESSSYTLKIRGGCDIDSHGKKAGKGALVQTELSGTLGVSQDQTLITNESKNIPMVVGCDLYNQTLTGDTTMSITGAATDPHHVPCVCFEPGSSSRVGGHVYEDDVSGSLRANAGDNQQSVVCIEGNGVRESHKGDGYKESDTMYTLNTVEQHAVAYGLDRASFNQGKNAKFSFSVDEELAPSLVAKGPGGY